MARSDNRYCWLVASAKKEALAGVRGLDQGTRDQYVLEYRTNPDDSSFTFVPGIGITAYDYHHHGTVADTELKLVEFHPADIDHR
jgi:hypothetical protein